MNQEDEKMSKFCKSCGSRLSNNAKFCDKCGSRVDTPRVDAPSTNTNIRSSNRYAPTCPRCHAEVPFHSKKCYNCGYTLNDKGNKLIYVIIIIVLFIIFRAILLLFI